MRKQDNTAIAAVVFGFCLLGLNFNPLAQAEPVVAKPHNTQQHAMQSKPHEQAAHAKPPIAPQQSVEKPVSEKPHLVKPESKKVVQPVTQESEETLNLGQVTKSSDKASATGGLAQNDFFRVYSGLIFVLGVILLSLWLLRKSQWFQQLKANIGAPVDAAAVPNKLPQKSPALDKQFYQPQIMHRTRLGPNKELLTVYQAGQWMLLGSTANQVNLVAKLDELQTQALPTELANDAGFQHIYDKYVEPLKQESPTKVAEPASLPQPAVQEMTQADYLEQPVPSGMPFRPQFLTEDVTQAAETETVVAELPENPYSFAEAGYEEEQLKDFEDWYDGPFVSATMPKGRNA